MNQDQVKREMLYEKCAHKVEGIHRDEKCLECKIGYRKWFACGSGGDRVAD
jgi:hypothetical protein